MILCLGDKMGRTQNKKAIRQAIADNFTVGRKFKANELQAYTNIPSHIIGRYLAQFDNVKIVSEETNRHNTRIRIYEVIQ